MAVIFVRLITTHVFWTVYRCWTRYKEAARYGDEICHSCGGGRRGQGGPGLLPWPGWVHDRALQLREHPCHSYLFLLIQAQRAELQEGTKQLWIHGECDDGELKHGHDELFILKVPQNSEPIPPFFYLLKENCYICFEYITGLFWSCFLFLVFIRRVCNWLSGAWNKDRNIEWILFCNIYFEANMWLWIVSKFSSMNGKLPVGERMCLSNFWVPMLWQPWLF